MKLLIKLCGMLLGMGLFGFVLFKNDSPLIQLQQIHFSVLDYFLIGFSLCLIILHTLAVCHAWRFMLTALNTPLKLPQRQLENIFFPSLVAKYIPGGIWNYAGRVYGLKRQNIPVKTAAFSLVIEQWLALALCIAISGLLIGLSLNQTHPYLPLLGLLAGLISIFCLIPDAVLMIVNPIARLIKATPIQSRLNQRSYWLSVLWHIAALLLYALAYYSCYIVISEHPSLSLIDYTAAVLAATAIGFLAPFVPGGLGIREFALGAIIFSLYQIEIEPVIIALPRLLIIFAELILYTWAITRS